MGIDPINEIIHFFHISCSSKYMIPDGKDISIITIRIGLYKVMVYFVEMGSNNNI